MYATFQIPSQGGTGKIDLGEDLPILGATFKYESKRYKIKKIEKDGDNFILTVLPWFIRGEDKA